MKILDLLFGSESLDIIECEFIQSDLKDIPISEREQWQSAQLDSLANNHQLQDDDPRPMGKRVY